MADKFCPQCGEKVDQAKAFCPACGHAFLDEEKRTDASAYEKMDNTVQMGQTMYNNMLSDMGLNLKKEPEKRVEVLKPVVVQPAQTLQPVAGTQPVQTPAPPAHADAEPKKSNKKFWIITMVVAVALLLIFAIAVIAVGLYLYFYSGRF
ncbi:MAG: zinc-ribbon domain-containing protein [Pyrinomonadaceae bacterium]